MKVKIKKEVFLYLQKFASTNPHRYNLAGVHFSETGEAVATDGHKLARITEAATFEPDEGEQIKPVSFEIGKDAITLLKKSKGQEITFIFKNSDEHNTPAEVFTEEGARLPVSACFYSYPNYKKVIPTQATDRGPAGICINPELLKDFIFKKGEGVKIEFSDDTTTAPLLIHVESLPNMTGVLMPMRFF